MREQRLKISCQEQVFDGISILTDTKKLQPGDLIILAQDEDQIVTWHAEPDMREKALTMIKTYYKKREEPWVTRFVETWTGTHSFIKAEP